MRIFGLLFLLLLNVSSVQAQIFKWTDSNGNTHFTDRPRPGAVEINLPASQTYTPSNQNGKNAPPEAKTGGEVDRSYRVLRITQPQDEATIRNNQGYVPVIVNIEPELKPGDKLQILYDGEPLGEPKETTVFALSDVKRGSHTISVQALDEEGNVLNTSKAITIYMHRPRVGMVPGTKPRPNPGN